MQMTKSLIGKTVIGYNIEKNEWWKNLYLMKYIAMKPLRKNYITANAALNEIAKLDKNWNGNGANPFSAGLIKKCRKILMQLAEEPFISPTACGSVQFEYEKENGEYLEFEIYEDRIEVFLAVDSNEEEFNLQGSLATDKMKQLVEDFYGKKELGKNIS